MKKTIIGYLYQEHAANKTKTKQKESIYKKALATCEEFISIDSEEDFKNSFSKYAIEICTKNLGLKNPNMDKIIQLTNIPLTRIKQLEMEYKRINLDAAGTDYNIYATTEKQIEEYKTLLNVCNQLNELKVYTLKTCEAFNNRIMDFNGILCPNPYYIKSL